MGSCSWLTSTSEDLLNFGNNITACDALQNTQTEASNLVVASTTDGSPTLTLAQATAIAQGDVAAGGKVPDLGCSTFADLSNQTPFSAQWFTCFQEVIGTYAEYLIIGLIVLIVLYLWVRR